MEKVKNAIEDFGKKVVEAVKRGKGEADKVARTAQVKLEIGSLKRQQRDLYQELGELFYRNLGKKGKKDEAQVAECVSHIAEVDRKVASLNRELKSVREGKASPVKKAGRPARAAAAEKAAPKRRGRPPKAAAAEGEKAPAKRRGRPAKKAAPKASSTAPKRRGRPPKSAQADKS